jgi:hypothetical protein
MATSIFLAKFFSIYLIVIAILMLVKQHKFIDDMKAMLANHGVTVLANIVTLLLGAFLVAAHNVWMLGWPVLITILAWLTLIKGIVRLFVTDIDVKLGKLIESKTYFYISGVISLIIGLFLGFHGFFPTLW